MKKLLSIMLVLAMLAMCLTGCGEQKSTEPASSGSSEPAAPEKITIAFIGNTTGDYAMYGIPVRNATKMYFDQLNAAGGINGKQIELIEYDDKADPTETVNALNLAVEKGATAIVGSVLTGATVALSDATFEINMPQITASATSPKVTVADPDAADPEVKTNVFRACFLDPFQGEKMAEYAAEICGAKKIAIFYESGSDYSEAIVSGFESKAGEFGLTVVDKEAFSTGDKDYRSQMTNIASADPDVVLMPIYYGEAGLAITALRAAGCSAQVIGGDGFGSVKDYASAEDLEGTVYFSGYAPGTESVAKFEADYEATFKEAVPNMFAPLAWDASMIMAEGIKAAEAAGQTPGSAEYKQTIIDTIKNMNAFEGITGSYTFNETNDPVKSVAVIKLAGGNEEFDSFF